MELRSSGGVQPKGCSLVVDNACSGISATCAVSKRCLLSSQCCEWLYDGQSFRGLDGRNYCNSFSQVSHPVHVTTAFPFPVMGM